MDRHSEDHLQELIFDCGKLNGGLKKVKNIASFVYMPFPL